jgi:glycosyltransferase involved in cell wall biosynthesis
LIVSELYPPDGSINGRRLHAVAVGLLAAGVEVTTITSQPHYRTGRTEAGTSDRERRDDVPVRRLRTFALGKQSLVARGATALLFAVMAFAAVLTFRPRPGVILSMSPSLFTGVAAGIAARLRGAAFVYDIEDFHPDVAIEVGAVRNRLLILTLRALERLVLSLCSHVIVISEGFRAVATGRGVSPARLSVVPNWADPPFFDVPPAPEGSTLMAMFIGTHGLAQDLDVLIDAAALCPEIAFVFVGDGVAKPRAVIRATKLSNVQFLASQAHESVASTLRDAHVTLVSLRPGRTLSATIPSKTYEYMAAARPVIAVAGKEVEQLIADAGICVPSGSSAIRVADALRQLLERDRRVRMGARAREIASQFARDAMVARYVALLNQVR